MMPPGTEGDRLDAEAPDAPSAVFACPKPAIETMQIRAEYLKAASARRQGTGSFLLQGRFRGDDLATIRVGFTASKKIGNAVARNRAKRRMRAMAREVLPKLGREGWDYVLVARPDATTVRPYAEMLRDLETALASVHAPKAPRPPKVEQEGSK